MPRYFSWRRRFSEPEKPEPRFQWRVRVNSLMMDDGKDREEERQRALSKDGDIRNLDSENEQLGAVGGAESGAGMKLSHADESSHGSLSPACKDRRERFSRTKSEGHLKLRVKFSRTIDADDDSSDASPELNRRRTLPIRSKTLKEEGSSSHPERTHRRYLIRTKDDGGGANGPSRSEETKRYNGLNNFSSLDSTKDTSRGAVPKHNRDRPKAHGSNDSISSDEDDFQGRGKFAKSSSPDSAIGESLPNTQAVSRERSPSVTDVDKTYGSVLSGGEGRIRAQNFRKVMKYDSVQDCGSREPNAGPSCPSSSEDDAASDGGGGGDGTANDIESIIEKIIAEEELGVQTGISEDNALAKKMGNLLKSSDSTSYGQEIQELQETIDDCNREMEASIELSRQDKTVENHRFSSLPPTGQENGDETTAIIPYSSSLPSRQARLLGAMEETNDKEDTSSDNEDVLSSWSNLPMILLEDVLTLLTPKERHLASQVCRQWYDLFYSPRVWETFILLERTLTKKRFNFYKGYQRELCPGKTQLCFRRVGSFFKRIVVTPITDYFNLYEFMRVLAAFLQFREDHGESAMPLLHTFDFTFACATRADEGVIIHGTGGQILEMIKQLLTRMKGSLRHLKLDQLLLDTSEVSSLFHALVQCFSDCLHSLELLNVTKVPLPLSELANFRNLVKLVVSPQHLSEECVLLLSGINLLQLHILQDPYTCVCDPVAPEAWKLARESAPWLRVYLEVAGNTKTQLLIQPRAPVYGIFLRSPHGKLSHDLLMALVDNYAQTLRYFVQERLPRTHGPRGFEHRCDSALLFFVRRCPRLHTLVLRERISTATLLLLATDGRGLTTLLVRQNALLKRCDWPQRGEFPVDFYKRLKEAALDYQRCTDEMCSTLRRRWRPMSDRQFMQLKIVPRLEMC
ncbi:hypothetical protein PoB_006314700 [Plakobranchus ocellatus]|uniref:F-box domain-containing protein n=1 Tax=Plakobranchus ocellatus TaxID=259542 RepID=A0AAV4CXK2_9GAST|nr:hypothetical protein PoB_006314700 [Plakobranchus ocellatus]